MTTTAGRATVRSPAFDRLTGPPPWRGPIRWDIPESIRNAIAEDIASGAFARALTAVTAGDPEIQDQ
jgi:hypothetical protein